MKVNFGLVVTVDMKNRLRITIYRNLTRWFLPLVLQKSVARTAALIRSVNRLTVLVWVGRSWWYAHISERGRSRGW